MPRTLSVECDAIPSHLGEPALVATSLKGREGFNQLFEYELVLQTSPTLRNPNAFQPEKKELEAFLGRPLFVRIEIDGCGEYRPGRPGQAQHGIGGGERQINTIVTAIEPVEEWESQAQYRLTLRPWLHNATLSTDCRIWQDQSVEDILKDLLAPYGPPVSIRVAARPARDLKVQYNESDFAFFERLCQEWGISYHFVHTEKRCELVLVEYTRCDPMPSEAYRQVAYHPPGWKTNAEYLHAFSLSHHTTSTRYITRDYDYTNPLDPMESRDGFPMPHGADREVFEWHGGKLPSHYAQPDAGGLPRQNSILEGKQTATRRLDVLYGLRKQARASGNLRGMVPGFSFVLEGHPRTAANIAYLVTESRLLIEEVRQTSQAPDKHTATKAGEWRVLADLTLLDRREPLCHQPTRSHPFTHGPQPAVVTGPENSEVWTDALGRIKVKFHWDRAGRSDESSSCWVRVLAPWAGVYMGAQLVPRIGHEVLIDFIDGNVNLPICIGSLRNSMTPFGWKLPSSHALSGLRSQELNVAGSNRGTANFNHLLLDDTARKVQAQLVSTPCQSQLSLGHIASVEYTGRRDERGLGMELRTDGHGAIRAGLGLLLTTHARKGAVGGIKELQETSRLLAQALEQLQAHTQAAVTLGVQDETEGPQLAGRMHAQNTEIAGKAAEAMSELSAPHLVVASPAGAVMAASHDVNLVAGESIALTSAMHTCISTGGSLLATAARAVRLLAHRGMRLFAAHGDLELQAQNDRLLLSAKKNTEISSSEGWVNVEAKSGIRLSVGGTCVEITATGIVLLTPGKVETHAASHQGYGPKNRAVRLNEMPTMEFDDRHRVVDGNDQPRPSQAWSVSRPDGDVPGGKSSAAGHVDHQRSAAPDTLLFEVTPQGKPGGPKQ